MSEELATMLTSQDLEGRVFGDYQLEKLVGKGGMAWVYKAEHRKFKETMAIKVLLPHLSSDEDLRGRFLEEAKIQFRLRHSHIVQVTDIIEEGQIYGFVMEWAEGKNLKQVLEGMEQPASRKDIWRIMGPILDAVGYAHQQGLVHRDIKPANILLHQENEDITPKIADFGIAKALDEEEGKTATGMTMGTLKFMPPEQIRDAKRVDHRADIYALGVTLYMMATLRLPFEGRQEFVIYQQMNEDPPPPSSRNKRLTPAFDRIVMKALARTPEERFQSCAEFGHALSLALIDIDNIKADQGDLDTNKIYNMLAKLPEENSIYQTSLTPLSPQLVKDLYSSHTSDTITKLQKFVLEGDPAMDTRLRAASNANVPEVKLSTEELSGDTMLHSGGQMVPPFKASGPATKGNPILMGIMVAIFLVGGGGVAWYFLMGPGAATNPPPQRRLATQAAATCQTGTSRPCYRGPEASKNQGICKAGVQSCQDGQWGACQGEVLPVEEVCDGKDNNCDGKVDESFANAGKACQLREGDCSFSGKSQCNAGKVVCQPTADTPSNIARLQVSPGGNYQIRYDRKQKTIGSRYCVSLAAKKNLRIRLSRRGYYACSFRVRRGKQSYRLRMKRVNPNDLDPSSQYCLR